MISVTGLADDVASLTATVDGIEATFSDPHTTVSRSRPCTHFLAISRNRCLVAEVASARCAMRGPCGSLARVG